MRLFENSLKMYQLRVLLGSQYISRNRQIFRDIFRGSVHLSNTLKRRQASDTCTRTLTTQVKSLCPIQRAFSKAETKTTSGRCYSSQSTSPDEGILIYTGNMGKTVLGVKFFSYSSSMFSLCVMPYIMMKNGIGVSSFTLKVALCGVIGFFTFITPVLLHLITKGYVVRLYHNKETDMYTAITYSALLTQKKTAFHQSDVRIPDVSSMFSSFYVKKQSMLVNPMLFDLPHDYNHLMGYDQPFSFDIEEVNKTDKN